MSSLWLFVALAALLAVLDGIRIEYFSKVPAHTLREHIAQREIAIGALVLLVIASIFAVIGVAHLVVRITTALN